MMKDIFYISDGIDPYKQYGIWDNYHKGGLMIKPKRRNSIIGGMPFTSIDDKHKNIYDYYDYENDVPKLTDVDEFIKNKNKTTDEIYENNLLEHMKEIIELYKTAKFYEDKEYKKINLKEFNKLQNEYVNILNEKKNDNKNVDDDLQKIKDIKEELKKVKKMKLDELIRDLIKRTGNEFYNEMTKLGIDDAKKIADKWENGTNEEKNEIENKLLGFDTLKNEIRNKFINLKNDKEKKDMIIDYASSYQKGNRSEDKLIDKDILLTFIDNDFSKAYNTKDINALNANFIQDLKDIGLNENEIKDKILEKLNVDVIKDNTIWELKAFNKNSYFPEKYDRYSKAKFVGSEPFNIYTNEGNYKINYSFIINENEKINNIMYFINKNNELKKSGYILKENNNGYNYYILENNKDTIQYMNPLKKENYGDIKNQLDNKKKTILINNNKFNKFPQQYIDNYVKIRLKKSNRTDPKNIYKNFDKIKYT